MVSTAFCLESTNSVRRCWPSLSLFLTFNIKHNVALEQNLISGRRFCWFRILWTSKWVSLAQTKNILPLRQKVQKPNWYFHLIMFKMKSVKIWSHFNCSPKCIDFWENLPVFKHHNFAYFAFSAYFAYFAYVVIFSYSAYFAYSACSVYYAYFPRYASKLD